jgi:hypothetical protein
MAKRILEPSRPSNCLSSSGVNDRQTVVEGWDEGSQLYWSGCDERVGVFRDGGKRTWTMGKDRYAIAAARATLSGLEKRGRAVSAIVRRMEARWKSQEDGKKKDAVESLTSSLLLLLVAMFKKPPALKPAAPLRASEGRKLAEEVASSFGIDLETAKLLVPKGILHSKATTHTDASVSIYSSETDPLWFRIGKGNDGPLVPTCPFNLLSSETIRESA